QNAEGLRFGLSHQLGIDPANVRVVSPYAGGAFGQKNSLGSHTTFVAVAARRLARPVKLVMPRDQTFYDAAFRPASRQRVKPAAPGQRRTCRSRYRETIFVSPRCRVPQPRRLPLRLVQAQSDAGFDARSKW